MADFTIPLKLETSDAIRQIGALRSEMERATRIMQQDIQQRLAQSASAGGAAAGAGAAAAGAGGAAGPAGPAEAAAGAGGGGPSMMSRARALMAQAAPITNMFNQAEGGAFSTRTIAMQEMALNAEIIPGIQNKAIIGAVAPKALAQSKADQSASNQVLDFAEQMGRAGGQMSQPEAQQLFKRFHAQETRGLEARMKARDAIEGETSMGKGLNFVMEKISSLFEKGASYQEHEH